MASVHRWEHALSQADYLTVRPTRGYVIPFRVSLVLSCMCGILSHSLWKPVRHHVAG